MSDKRMRFRGYSSSLPETPTPVHTTVLPRPIPLPDPLPEPGPDTPPIRGIVVCVDYDDLLRIVLARNLRHLQEIMVVTSPNDERTQALVRETPRARAYVTDAFYRRGATFNKGLAMEEGFDAMGRDGWIMVLDADILLPVVIDWSFLQPDCLYTPRRYVLADPGQYRDDMDWTPFPLLDEEEFAGYCQLFHAADPILLNRRPWYGIRWPHAGGCDSDFQYKWTGAAKVRPNFQVLHLGEDTQNWFGRISHRTDGQAAGTPAERQTRRRLMRRLRVDTKFRLAQIP